MSGPLQLWTTGDIARELELAKSAVYNWAYRSSPHLPEPYAVTQGSPGQRLYTAEQAKQIMADYHAREAAKRDRAQERAQHAEMLERAISGTLLT